MAFFKRFCQNILHNEILPDTYDHDDSSDDVLLKWGAIIDENCP